MWNRKRQHPATIAGGAQAQNLAQAIESADKNAKDLQGQQHPPMTAVNAVTSKRGPPRGTRSRADTGKSMEISCYRCGGRHAPRDCRFKDAVCHSCRKRGHLARGLNTFTSFHVPLSHDPPRGWGQGTSALMSNQGKPATKQK